MSTHVRTPVDTNRAKRYVHIIRLDWAREFMNQKMALDVARVAASKYVKNSEPQCHHDWSYDHLRGGMLCGACGEFVSDQL